MPPKKPEQTQFPSFAAARGVFAGNRGGKGNLAAAGTASTGKGYALRADLASSWIRSQVLCQLKQRPIANTHEEEGHVQALWLTQTGSIRLGLPASRDACRRSFDELKLTIFRPIKSPQSLS